MKHVAIIIIVLLAVGAVGCPMTQTPPPASDTNEATATVSRQGLPSDLLETGCRSHGNRDAWLYNADKLTLYRLPVRTIAPGETVEFLSLGMYLFDPEGTLVFIQEGNQNRDTVKATHAFTYNDNGDLTAVNTETYHRGNVQSSVRKECGMEATQNDTAPSEPITITAECQTLPAHTLSVVRGESTVETLCPPVDSERDQVEHP